MSTRDVGPCHFPAPMTPWSGNAVLAAASLAFACNRDPADLREWRPSDHRHQSETQAAAEQPAAPQVAGSAEAPMPGLDEVTIAAWRRACTPCHGQFGQGDGPQGPMVKARDLTDPGWQAATSDEQIATSISKGRGLMPAAALPPETVTNLIKLVRLLNRGRTAAPPDGEPGSPSPSAGAGIPAQAPR